MTQALRAFAFPSRTQVRFPVPRLGSLRTWVWSPQLTWKKERADSCSGPSTSMCTVHTHTHTCAHEHIHVHAHTRVCTHKCISLMNAVFKNCTKKTMYLLSDSVDTEHLGSWMAGRNKEWSVKGLDVLLWKVLKIFEVQLWVIHYVDHQKLFEKEDDDDDAGGAKERNHASRDTSWAHSDVTAQHAIGSYEHLDIWTTFPYLQLRKGSLRLSVRWHSREDGQVPMLSNTFQELSLPHCALHHYFTSVSPWL